MDAGVIGDARHLATRDHGSLLQHVAGFTLVKADQQVHEVADEAGQLLVGECLAQNGDAGCKGRLAQQRNGEVVLGWRERDACPRFGDANGQRAPLRSAGG